MEEEKEELAIADELTRLHSRANLVDESWHGERVLQEG
jgi:hypothetical protein